MDQLTLIIWGLALAPCLLVPPMFAIALAWRGQTRDGRPRADATWVTVVALFNIAFSLVVMIRFGHEVLSAFDSWRAYWRPQSPIEQPRLTPI